LGWATAGRLDINSTGLLVLTQSGRVAKTLIGPDVRVDKEYLVRVRPSPFFDRNQSTAAVLERLRDGIRDAGELLHAVSVERVNTDQLRFVLHEGKHRHIRRMCRAVGLEVDGLKRVRIGEIVLGNLPVGQWRYLAPHESFVPTVESIGPQ
jgi:23S rRNA pseudouridine2604 synthase